jgi:hypothetical protein
MKKIDLGQAVTILANIGVIAGIVFLVIEIRQNTTATQLMASESHMTGIIGQNDLIVANPQLAEVLSRAIAGEDLSPAENIQVTNLMGSRLLAWQNTYLQYSRDAIPQDVMDGFDQMMLDWMDGFALFIEYWESRTQRFSPEFVAHVRSVLSNGDGD